MLEIKELYHPKAHLQNLKNVRNGLKARTNILNDLERLPGNAVNIAHNIGSSYGAVMHHLKLLEAEKTVQRKGKRPCTWILTGLGQKRLDV